MQALRLQVLPVLLQVQQTAVVNLQGTWAQESDAPPCHECGTIMVRSGACYKCLNCAATSGCS